MKGVMVDDTFVKNDFVLFVLRYCLDGFYFLLHISLFYVDFVVLMCTDHLLAVVFR